MALIDKISEKITSGANSVQNSARRTADIAKAKNEISGNLKEIDELMKKIGLTVKTRLMDKVDDPEVKELADKIDSLIARNQELSDEVKALSSIRKCVKCGAELTPDAVFCAECGTRNDPKAPAAAEPAPAPAAAAEKPAAAEPEPEAPAEPAPAPVTTAAQPRKVSVVRAKHHAPKVEDNAHEIDDDEPPTTLYQPDEEPAPAEEEQPSETGALSAEPEETDPKNTVEDNIADTPVISEAPTYAEPVIPEMPSSVQHPEPAPKQPASYAQQPQVNNVPFMQPQMLVCPNCHCQETPDALFCSNCGTRLRA